MKTKSATTRSRRRPQNLAATVFIFQSTRKPFTTHAVYLDQASDYVGHPGWRHTATLEPALWIEHLLNHPGDREEHIERIMQ